MRKTVLLSALVLLILGELLLIQNGVLPLSRHKDAQSESAKTQSSQSADGNVVRVSDLNGFLAALAPNTVIEIDAEQLKLERAADYGFSYEGAGYSWQKADLSEYMLLIRDLDGLTIRSVAEGGTVVSTDALFADVLRFENCDDLTLVGLTLGHRAEVGGCQGDVLSLEGCNRVSLRGCELYGCGAVGINAYDCSELYLSGCTLRDCQFSAMNITNCTDVQARDCAITRCGRSSGLAALCVASCDGFALINSSLTDGDNSYLLDSMNSEAVCLLGCEVSGNHFSNALFCLYDNNITVSGSALADNEFGSCYLGGAYSAVNGAGQELLSFQDFARMERKPYTGDYVGPIKTETPQPTPDQNGEYPEREVTVTTVDELLANVAPHTTILLDGEEFDLSAAAEYGRRGGSFYSWEKEYDGYSLVLKDLEDFHLIGGGMGITLLSATPRYADVLSLKNCRDSSLSDMTLGHSEAPGYCSGGVLNLERCEGVSVTRCGLFGCGTIGIEAFDCRELQIDDSNIYDCSYVGVSFYDVDGAVFTGCSITDCGDDYGFNGLQLYDCTDIEYDGEKLDNGVVELLP